MTPAPSDSNGKLGSSSRPYPTCQFENSSRCLRLSLRTWSQVDPDCSEIHQRCSLPASVHIDSRFFDLICEQTILISGIQNSYFVMSHTVLHCSSHFLSSPPGSTRLPPLYMWPVTIKNSRSVCCLPLPTYALLLLQIMITYSDDRYHQARAWETLPPTSHLVPSYRTPSQAHFSN